MRSLREKCSPGSASDDMRAATEARDVVACKARLSMPDITATADDIEACVNRLRSGTCYVYGGCELPPGTRADGAHCVSSAQCKSGECTFSGAGTGPHCGVCAPRVPLGGDCSSGKTCMRGSVCNTGTNICVAALTGKEGGSCDPESSLAPPCADGLVCDYYRKTCIRPAAEGEACDTTSSYGRPCGAPLGCLDGKCAQPPVVGEGEKCSGFAVCAKGLACNTSADMCVRVNWVAPGGDCSDPSTRCQKGYCIAGKCPNVLVDGAACSDVTVTDPGSTVATTCDENASCIDGKCTLPGQQTCN